MKREYTLEELQNMGFYPDEYEGYDEWHQEMKIVNVIMKKIIS